jgi:hypothetical protein
MSYISSDTHFSVCHVTVPLLTDITIRLEQYGHVGNITYSSQSTSNLVNEE